MSGAKEYDVKGVYIFGHQPPNIGISNNDHENEFETDIITTSLVSSAHDGGLLNDQMNLFEGQKKLYS